MGIADLFQSLHGLLDLENIQPITKSPHLTREEIEYVGKELDIETYNLFYHPNNLHVHFYYDGTFYFEFFNIKDLKMFSSAENGSEQFDEDYRFKHQRAYVQKMLDKEDYAGVISFADKKVRFYVFCDLYNKMPKEQRLEQFLEVYSGNEYGFEFMDRKTLDELFSYPLAEQYRMPNDIAPDIDDSYYTIYRGQTPKSTHWDKAYSWTLDPQVALFFATRFNSEPTIYKAKIHKDKIKAFIDGRNEKEVIAYPEDILDTKEIDLSEAFK